jgi:tetratricopeptide (TPR) repeat protein
VCADFEEPFRKLAPDQARRVLDHYLEDAAAAELTLDPGRWRLAPVFRDVRPLASKDAAWDWLEGERANLRTAVEVAHERGWDEHVWWLCEALWSLYFLRGYYGDWVATHEMGARSAVRISDGAAEARMRIQLGFALSARSRGDEAVREFAAARDVAHAAGDPRGEAAAIEGLGLESLRRERWDEARETLEDDLRRAEASGDERAILLARHHLGRVACGSGDLVHAADLLEPLPDAFLALDHPDRYNRGRALTSLGEVCLRRRLPDIAINFFGQALEIMRAERADVQEADVWRHFAEAARFRSDPDAERAALNEAARVEARFHDLAE